MGSIIGVGFGVLLVVHIIYSIIVGAFASTKETGFWEGFFLSICFSPIIAIICVYLDSHKNQ